MSQFFQVHPDNPQARLIQQALDIVQKNGVIAYPTDSAYALGCSMDNKSGLDRIRAIRRLDDKHNMTLICRDLSDISNFAKLDNTGYRTIKAHTPGPYTFILPATSEVPRRMLHPKRRQIGIRIPDNQIVSDLLAALGEPMMSTTLILPGDEHPMTDPYDIRSMLEHQVDLVIDGGYCGFEPTSVIDMTTDVPSIWRRGQGDVSAFEE